MRHHAISFTLVCFASLTTGVFFLACGADDKAGPGGGAKSGHGGGAGFDLDTILKSGDSGGPDGSVEKDGSLPDASEAGTPKPEAGPPSCESCGSAESVKKCGSALTACRANTGCKRIYECIYTYRGCGLTSSDIDCIQGCFDDYCEDSESISLYLAYDQCTYCSPTCAEACSSYCSGFPEGGMIATRCTDGASDAGPSDSSAPDAGGEAGSGGSGGGDDPADDPDDPSLVCVPGRQEACACIGGSQGAQICNSNGTGFGPCYCPKPDAGSEGSHEGGSGGSGGAGEDEDD